MPPKKRKIPPHPSGMAEPPMSKTMKKEEKEREVAKKFFDSARTLGYYSSPSIQGALDKLPKGALVGLDPTGGLLINGYTREEFHAHGCPFEFADEWTVDGTVGAGDNDGSWFFEGTLIENNGNRACEIEFYYPGKNKKKKQKITLANCERKGKKEKPTDFIMREDYENLKKEMVDEVFCYYYP